MVDPSAIQKFTTMGNTPAKTWSNISKVAAACSEHRRSCNDKEMRRKGCRAHENRQRHLPMIKMHGGRKARRYGWR